MESVYLTTFNYSTVLKGGKKEYFVEGYASTIDKDYFNETITLNGQLHLLSQFVGRTITLDLEHSAFRSENKIVDRPKAILPVGKVVDAQLKSKGVWIKVKVFEDHPQFSVVWKAITEGLLHAFSVAFTPVEYVKKNIKGIIHTYFDKLNLINVAITGTPVNPNATFAPVMKALLKNINGETMTDVDKNTPDKTEDPVIVEEPTEQSETNDVKPVEDAPTETQPTEEPEETKEPEETSEPTEDPKPVEENLKSIVELKSIVDSQKKTITEQTEEIKDLKTKLKALSADFEEFKTAPVFKGKMDDITVNKNTENYDVFKYV